MTTNSEKRRRERTRRVIAPYREKQQEKYQLKREYLW